MQTPIDICTLREAPDFLPTLAEWHQREWQYPDRPVSLPRRIQRLRSHIQHEALPNTWIALEQNQLIGSISLVDYVFQQDIDASAWVANLFVVPAYRKQGIGRRLLSYAQQQACSIHIYRLYLFTLDLREFYQRQDWSFLHQARVRGLWVDVMVKNLRDLDQPPIATPLLNIHNTVHMSPRA